MSEGDTKESKAERRQRIERQKAVKKLDAARKRPLNRNAERARALLFWGGVLLVCYFGYLLVKHRYQ